MRIIAGKWKRLQLKFPNSLLTRPTSDQLRETMFNILNSYFLKNDISYSNLNVLDAFAGSGALGLEALSRGAKSVTFIEYAASACHIIQENINTLRAQAYCHLISQNIFNLKAAPPSAPYNLLFLDPPYAQGLCEKTLIQLLEQNWLAPDVLIILETAATEALNLPSQCQVEDYRTSGHSALRVLSLRKT